MQSEQLNKALGYKKFSGARSRVLIFNTGYLVVRDVIDAAEDLGWEVKVLDTPAKGLAQNSFIADLITAVVRHQPDFLFTINHLGFDEKGILAELLARFSIPCASWFVDHPLPILGGSTGCATSFVKAFCFERTALDWLAQRSFEDPVYLPTASNGRYYHPRHIGQERIDRLAWPLTFAGNSWWIKAREEPPIWARRSVKELRRKFQLDRTFVKNRLASVLPRAKIKLKDPRQRYFVAGVALAESSMQTRGRFAQALQPLGLRIHGDPYWEKLAPGVDQQPFLSYEEDLPALFAGSAVNANVTAEQMPTAVNQRVWDVPAVGGFLLTDAQEDAQEFFEEDKEMAIYSDLEEAVDKARFYLAHPELTRGMAQRALEKVERHHRFTHRLERVAEAMRARYS